MITWFAVLLRPGSHAQAHVVHANTAEERGDRLVLRRGDREVHRFEAAQVAEVVPCETRRAADDAAREWRERIGRSGAAGLSVSESGAPAPRGRTRAGAAIPLEGIRLKITE